MKISKKTVSNILLFITLLSIENFALLIPTNDYIISGMIKYTDLGLIFGCIYFIWIMFFVKSEKKIIYSFKKESIAFLILIFISSYMGQMLVSQSLFLGIRCLRTQILCFLLYFPITKHLQMKYIEKKGFLKIIYFICVFELVVYLLQYLLVNYVTFTHIDTNEMRNNSTRLRFPYLLQIVVSFISLGFIFSNKKENKLFHIIIIMMTLFLVIGITKNRAPSLILLLCYIIGYFIWKKNLGIKIIIGIILGFFCLTFLSTSELFKSTFNVFQSGLTTDGSFNARIKGQEYYFEKIKSSPLFGYGYPNTNSESALRNSGAYYSFFLADNGIIGFTYIYGLCGVLWIFILYFKILKKSYNIYKKQHNSSYLLYILYEFGNLYIGLHWYYYYPLPFCIMLCLINFDDLKYLKNKEGVN